jgi:hypothetical protein
MGNITEAWASGKDVPRNHCLIPPGRLTFLLVGHILPHSYVLPSPLWLVLGVDQRQNLPVAGSTGLSHVSVESGGRRKPPFSLLEFVGSRSQVNSSKTATASYPHPTSPHLLTAHQILTLSQVSIGASSCASDVAGFWRSCMAGLLRLSKRTSVRLLLRACWHSHLPCRCPRVIPLLPLTLLRVAPLLP